MAALDVLKTACLKKSFRSFNDLVPGEYIIQHFTLMNTNFGKRVRIDMDDAYMYLPERFAMGLNEAAIAELNASPKIMIFSGKDSKDRNRLILDFKTVSYFTDQFADLI